MPHKPKSRICEICRKEYLGIPSRKYCGYKCSKKARESKKSIHCANCSNEFLVWSYRDAKYCSYKCKYEHKSSPIIEGTCHKCGKKFQRKAHKMGLGNIYCSRKCLLEFNKRENHYEWKEGLHDKHLTLALKEWGRIIKKRDNYACKKCGETDRKQLEAHHVKHRNAFPEFQFDLDNGITLCLTCHAREHERDSRSHRLILYKLNKLKELCPR